MPIIQSRRRFINSVALGGAVSLLHPPRAVAAEGSLETTTVRLPKVPAICVTPQYAAEELLRAEGFTEVRYVDFVNTSEIPAAIGRGEFDFALNYAPQLVAAIDVGQPITVLAGLHVGCFELFGKEGIGNVADLKEKSVGVQALGSLPQVLVTLMAAEVGVKDIHWVTNPSIRPIELFAEGKIDAFLATPPEPQDLRARHIGHVIVNSSVDHPWSQYFCCMLAGNREFVRKYPVAAKRVVRAILKAADLCVAEPAGVARRLIDTGFTPRYDYALQTLSEVPYDKWREYDAEDTIRFYALRLRDAGFIKSSPQKIIAEGTDWRFLNELKRELKA
jgi:NitT/TauT family transport system substrate-binding protein